ncbi:MAG: ATP synthase F1 subunit epsilon [Treponema sp.]|jgi:F-type H+-transporting ATPase subunit epsilon|nr:ATP synthase F1 subunit epsilon [Treponema sp.]
MARLFPFEVHTPYRLFFSEKVEAVSLTLTDGEIAVYAGHSAFTAPTVTCILKIRNRQGQWKAAFVSDGILEVKEHKTVLMADAAEWPEEIDPERAREAQKRAEEHLVSGMLKFEIDNAAQNLRRARYRLKAWELNRQAPPIP